jgi:hypothetical protein
MVSLRDLAGIDGAGRKVHARKAPSGVVRLRRYIEISALAWVPLLPLLPLALACSGMNSPGCATTPRRAAARVVHPAAVGPEHLDQQIRPAAGQRAGHLPELASLPTLAPLFPPDSLFRAISISWLSNPGYVERTKVDSEI